MGKAIRLISVVVSTVRPIDMHIWFGWAGGYFVVMNYMTGALIWITKSLDRVLE